MAMAAVMDSNAIANIGDENNNDILGQTRTCTYCTRVVEFNSYTTSTSSKHHTCLLQVTLLYCTLLYWRVWYTTVHCLHVYCKDKILQYYASFLSII
jgi:hypothetical protein